MLEIERKFLVKEDTFDIVINSVSDLIGPYQIEQLYLSTGILEARLRREALFQNVKYTFTAKSPGNLIREETEVPVELTDFQWKMLLGSGSGLPRLRKTRYKSRTAEGYELVLDNVHLPDKEVYLCEVEFPTEEAARNWMPYSWLGDEVTGDANYRMVKLCER